MDEHEKFLPFSPDDEVRRSRRNLPHWEQAGRTYFVTFRLGDSIPTTKLAVWKSERDRWRGNHPEPWSTEQWREYDRLFLARIERWADAGSGQCLLCDPGVRGIVERAFLFFDPVRYLMDQFVIMPNHVHLLFRPQGGWTLAKILHSWKSFTSHRINATLDRSGSLWMDERFDHIVRSASQLDRFRRYIANNPRKAGLNDPEFTLWERDL